MSGGIPATSPAEANSGCAPESGADHSGAAVAVLAPRTAATPPSAAAGEHVTAPDRESTSSAPTTQQPGKAELAGKRVVICEDEAVTQMQLRRALTRAGMQVDGIATNGQEAIDTTLREHPDLVLMDIRMPVLDGITATRRILEEYPVCVVMLTAFSNDGYQEQARLLGASGYIIKPITSDVLLPLLKEALATFYRRQS